MGNLALPGNPRYQPKDLQSVFGYDNLFRAVAEVEIATLKTLADIGIIPEAKSHRSRLLLSRNSSPLRQLKSTMWNAG